MRTESSVMPPDGIREELTVSYGLCIDHRVYTTVYRDGNVTGQHYTTYTYRYTLTHTPVCTVWRDRYSIELVLVHVFFNNSKCDTSLDVWNSTIVSLVAAVSLTGLHAVAIWHLRGFLLFGDGAKISQRNAIGLSSPSLHAHVIALTSRVLVLNICRTTIRYCTRIQYTFFLYTFNTQ